MPEKYRHFLRITLPLIVTVVGIVMTLFAYRFLDSSERNGQEQRFNSLASAAVESIQQKISQYSFVLDAAQALYASSDYIDKSEWRIFSQISHFSSLREIKETGVIVPVDTDKIPAFLKDTIKSGHASFQIKSHSKAQRLLIKKYVEPERESHKIGEDLSDNANIITICDLSQKKDAMVLTEILPPLRSVTQETTLIFVIPLHPKPLLSSNATTKNNLVGWAYILVSMNDLMSSAGGEFAPFVNMDISIPTKNSYRTPFYSSQPYMDVKAPRAKYRISRQFSHYGIHGWDISITSTRKFEEEKRSLAPKIMFAAGTCITLLFSLLIWALNSARQHAVSISQTAMENFEQSEKKFRLLFETSPIGLALTDMNGHFTLVNPCFCKLVGRTEEELLKLKTWDITPTDYFSESEKLWSVIRDRGQFSSTHKEFIHKSGHRIPVLLNGTVIEDHENHLSVWYMAIDMTDRLAMEKQLQEARKLESLGVLAGGIAHDFNNLLTTILGNANLAAMDVEENENTSRLIHNIEDAAVHAGDLCKQMLAYSEKGIFIAKKILLNQLLAQNQKQISSSVSSNVRIHYHLAPSLPAIMADGLQIVQVVTNLVTNASEAIIHSSGTITITTGAMQIDADFIKQCVHSDSTIPGNFVFIEVNDNGSGMSSDVMNKMFDPFYSTKFTGRGLGLPAVSGIVRRHKGALKVTSEPNVGTCFTVYFPACTA